jgi:uncharacterized protein YyaL (SSP411 family)
LQDLRLAELDAITTRVLDALVHEEHVDAVDAGSLTFLLRQYLSTDRQDLRDALGTALASALEHAASEPSSAGRAAWVMLFAEVAAIAEDDRIVATIGELVASLRAEWPASRSVDEGSAAVEACLVASTLLDPQALVPSAIDQLEHVVGGAYQPGAGVRGGLANQVRAASALLTAFEITGRLPYSMLAEELMQSARRAEPERASPTAFLVHCDAARVFCRLAALHDDADYRKAAVILSDADYRGDAARILAAQSTRLADAPAAHAAAYGLALLDLLK